MNIEIRLVNKEEVFDMAQINVKSWQEDYRGVVPDKVIGNLDPVEESKSMGDWLFEDCDDIRLGYGAFANGVMAGYITASLADEVDSEFDVEVNNLFVLKEYRGLGLGLKLLHTAAIQYKERGFTSIIIYNWRDTLSNQFYRSLKGRVVKEQVQSCGGKELNTDIFMWNLEQFILVLEDKLKGYK